MLGLLTVMVTVVHFLALAYIGLGGFLAWLWPRSFFVHVFFAAWGVAVNVFTLACPLTVAEDFLRQQRGLDPLPGGFNEYYIYGTLIPHSILPFVGVAALLLVAVSYVGLYVLWRHRVHESNAGHGHSVRLG
ncbi:MULTISPECIES: DUF2784 domain-containing protein [Prauserella salsuginis group]|uniref:DUF2784 domain-containing protein n=2 Tax=Prauserella salsuginis group TaxID=2893672 RepID=A0A839XSU6_9PSEU|nr:MULTISPECIES: DUF2784 domain-containing protein [Prauserella salsuginis group]MBB3662925.1 hypothetical protein [Prauserella sediminis]MCR3721339.1 Protein of Unknown function (DUF2784) [Prauserella flava]MCR3734581.1 Protein of Unknown function (DUF2784) [Prauserella salsuginis]